MNIDILRYSLFGIAGGQEVDRNFLKCIVVVIVDTNYLSSHLKRNTKTINVHKRRNLPMKKTANASYSIPYQS